MKKINLILGIITTLVSIALIYFIGYYCYEYGFQQWYAIPNVVMFSLLFIASIPLQIMFYSNAEK